MDLASFDCPFRTAALVVGWPWSMSLRSAAALLVNIHDVVEVQPTIEAANADEMVSLARSSTCCSGGGSGATLGATISDSGWCVELVVD